MSRNLLPVYALLSVTGAAVVGVGLFTYNVLKEQNENLAAITQAVQQLKEQPNSPTGDLAPYIEQALVDMQEREQQTLRASMFEGYSNASNDWDGPNWIYGSPDARFTMVVYADTECSYCRQFHPTPKGIVDASKGNVNWEYQHLVVFGDQSLRQAQASECIGEQLGNRAYWVYLSGIYANTQGSGKGADMRRLAQDVGADLSAFDTCVSSGSYISEIQASSASARAMGITGTPATVLVDNHTGETQMLGGAQPTEAFVQVMRQMMQQDS